MQLRYAIVVPVVAAILVATGCPREATTRTSPPEPSSAPSAPPPTPEDPDERFLRNLAQQLVRPRNARPRPETTDGLDRRLQVSVGGPPGRPDVPPAILDVWIFEPRARRRPRAARTVVILHGLGDSKSSMAGLAHILTGRGMRAIAVDLRGHGRSTGDHIAYGAFEAGDVVQVLDALADPQVLGDDLEPVGLYATSYGAHIAVQAGALDDRVDRVVAVGAYRSLRHEVPHFVTLRYPERAHLSPDRVQEAVDAAGAIAGFDPDDASAEAAVRGGNPRVLFIHGTEDEVVPIADAEALAEACGVRCLVHPLEGKDHLGSMRGPPLRRALLAWLEGRFRSL